MALPLEEETMLILAGMLGGAEGEDVPLYHGESLHKKFRFGDILPPPPPHPATSYT